MLRFASVWQPTEPNTGRRTQAHTQKLALTTENHFNLPLQVKRVFYASSACIYPEHIQDDPKNPGLKESDAWPANPQVRHSTPLATQGEGSGMCCS